MIFFGGVLGLVALAVWIFCIIDAVTTPAPQMRYLPKLAWVAIVVFLVDLGSLAWLLVGRPWNARAMTPGGRMAAGAGGAGAGRPGAAPRRRAATRPTNPDDDDEFLASLAKRNERRDDPPADGTGPQPA